MISAVVSPAGRVAVVRALISLLWCGISDVKRECGERCESEVRLCLAKAYLSSACVDRE